MVARLEKIRQEVKDNPDRLLISFTCGEPDREIPVPLTRVFALLVGNIGNNGEPRVMRLAGKVVDQGKWIRFADYWRCHDRRTKRSGLFRQRPTDGRLCTRAGLNKLLEEGSRSLQFRSFQDNDWELLATIEEAFDQEPRPYLTSTESPFYVVGRQPYPRFSMKNILDRMKDTSPILQQSLDAGLSIRESLSLAQEEICLDTEAGAAWPFQLCYVGTRAFADATKLDTWYHARIHQNGVLDKHFISITYKC